MVGNKLSQSVINSLHKLDWKKSNVDGELVATPNRHFWSLWNADKNLLKAAGVRVSKNGNSWEVHCLESVLNDESSIKQPVDAQLDLPQAQNVPVPDGLVYKDFQKAAIAYASNRKACLIADEPGLGKTIEAIGTINNFPKVSSVLVICPASLVNNWKREFAKWCVHQLSVGVVKHGRIPETDVVIMSYEMATRLKDFTHSKKWTFLVLDESHYCKNPQSKRTMAILGSKKALPIDADRFIFLTGTPILNRPAELWTTVNFAGKYTGFIVDWMTYHTRYCAAFLNSYGWDVSGASNLDELQNRLRKSFMIRRTKEQVLKELPRKIRQIIELEPENKHNKELISKQQTTYAKFVSIENELKQLLEQPLDDKEYRERVKKLRTNYDSVFSELSRLRREVGIAKAPQVISFIFNALLETDKIVVFAHHIDVINQIYEAFKPIAVTFYGSTSNTEKIEAVDKFQNDPNIRLFIGGIKAAGLGLTLTAASRCLFAEVDWTPSVIIQCEDRLHRIGQMDSVICQYLVFNDSLDAKLMHEMVKKQEVIEQAIG